LLLSTGDARGERGAEGGWRSSPRLVGADANYYNRAIWHLKRHNSGFVLENAATKRLLFSTGEPVERRGHEGGWKSSPAIVGADDNYYDRAVWHIVAR
jgi:hypothetical protein